MWGLGQKAVFDRVYGGNEKKTRQFSFKICSQNSENAILETQILNQTDALSCTHSALFQCFFKTRSELEILAENLGVRVIFFTINQTVKFFRAGNNNFQLAIK